MTLPFVRALTKQPLLPPSVPPPSNSRNIKALSKQTNFHVLWIKIKGVEFFAIYGII